MAKLIAGDRINESPRNVFEDDLFCYWTEDLACPRIQDAVKGPTRMEDILLSCLVIPSLGVISRVLFAS